MKPGSVVPMKKCVASFPDRSEFTFGCNQTRKGERMMFLYLGTTMDSDKFPAEAVIRQLVEQSK